MVNTEEKLIQIAEMKRSYRSLLKEAEEFFKDEENARAFEAWQQKEESHADQCKV